MVMTAISQNEKDKKMINQFLCEHFKCDYCKNMITCTNIYYFSVRNIQMGELLLN